jgi:hypothetical protein
LWLLTFAGYGALRTNFWYGQYYVFLLWLITGALYSLLRKKDAASGVVTGIAFMLKSYSGPFLLLFAAKRNWRAVTGMAVASAILGAVAIAFFGWDGVTYFATQVAPRAVMGEIADPYNRANGTVSTFLHRAFIRENELNPHPWMETPGAYFFLRTFFALVILALPVLAVWSKRGTIQKREFAWFMVATLLVSPNTATYTFVLLVLPVALLLEDAALPKRIGIVFTYVLLTLLLWPAWNWLFPKVLLLGALYLECGRGSWSAIRARNALVAGVLIVIVSSTDAFPRTRRYWREPGRRFTHAVTMPGSLYAASPAVSDEGLVFEWMERGRYVLRLANEGGVETFGFPGHAFHPTMPDAGEAIYFELAAAGSNRIARFDMAAHRMEVLPLTMPYPEDPAASHDGGTLAVVSEGSLWLITGGKSAKLAAPGPARHPTFAPGDRQIAYALGDGDRSRIMSIDLDTGKAEALTPEAPGMSQPALSPNGKWLAYASRETGTMQVWVQELRGKAKARLTDGDCNNSQPAWSRDSARIVFASDCGRGFGLTALYEANSSRIVWGR